MMSLPNKQFDKIATQSSAFGCAGRTMSNGTQRRSDHSWEMSPGSRGTDVCTKWGAQPTWVGRVTSNIRDEEE